MPWRPQVFVGPRGLTLVRRTEAVTLAWDDHVRLHTDRQLAWSLATRLALEHTRSLVLRRGRRSTNISTWFAPTSHDTTAAFVEYVAATPTARAAVGGIRDLPASLAKLHYGPPVPRRASGSLFHSRDRHLLILRTLDLVWPRRFGGHPVEGEPRPTVDDVINALLPVAPRWIQLTPEAELRSGVTRHLAIGAWAFPRLFP